MPPNMPPPPQGALSQAAGPQAPAPASPPLGPPPAGPQAGPGGPPAGPGAPGAPPPGGPPAAPARQPKPGNEGLINRVLGLISGETKQKEREEHQQALVEAMRQGAAQALQGVSALTSMAQQSDPTERIRGLMSQAGPPAMSGSGMARGGYPDLIGLDEPPGLPVRDHFARGGGNAFVPPNGQSGRSDQVEARLSPNEYVMDAETVSMLGDGSPDAGANKLDQFRANVRKHKGRALAKGKFSPNARKPESYLT